MRVTMVNIMSGNIGALMQRLLERWTTYALQVGRRCELLPTSNQTTLVTCFPPTLLLFSTLNQGGLDCVGLVSAAHLGMLLSLTAGNVTTGKQKYLFRYN
jgi:hypothetical protein